MKFYILAACVTATLAASISPLKDATPPSLSETPCKVQTKGCPIGRCFGSPPPGCSFSTMLIERPAWNDDMSDLCCPEVCVFRKDTSSGKGTGDQCYVQRTTATARTTPAPLPACPQPCKGIYDGFRARGYSDKACIDLAKNGYMCTNTKGIKMACDAEAAGFVKGHADCVGGKVFTECGSACPLTCDTMDTASPFCMGMCVVGCFCTKDTPIWDEASEMCMQATDCPGKNQCEGMIGENYLNTGNLKSDCKGTEDDDKCYSSGCVDAMCVPDGDWDAGSKMDKVCGKSTDEKDCVEGTGNRKRCKWAVGAPNGMPPPVFVCSSGQWVYGKGECAFDEPAGVTTVAPNVEAACSFLQESECYESSHYVDDDDSGMMCDMKSKENVQCFGIVKTALNNCGAKCLNFNAASTDPKCGECVEDALFNTRTIDASVPDIYTCCSCLDAAFAAVKVSASEVARMLQLTCSEGDDYSYDYDGIFDD